MLGIFGKPKWLMGLLAAAFLVPYALFDQSLRDTVTKFLPRSQPDDAEDQAPAGEAAAADLATATTNQTSECPPLCDMASAFSFDITPQWVTESWPRVTTVVGDSSHAGMRVPLVTGVMPDDLVGTLTYYFDDRQRVQRITFSGTTGDARRLVGLVTGEFGLQPQPTLDAGLYQTKWNGTIISTLHLRHASVVAAEARHGKLDVQLDLKRANDLAARAAKPLRLPGW